MGGQSPPPKQVTYNRPSPTFQKSGTKETVEEKKPDQWVRPVEPKKKSKRRASFSPRWRGYSVHRAATMGRPTFYMANDSFTSSIGFDQLDECFGTSFEKERA